MSDATIKAFKVKPLFVEDMRKTAVRESDVVINPEAPLVVDTTKAADQYGLRPKQIRELKKNIIPGSGKIGVEKNDK